MSKTLLRNLYRVSSVQGRMIDEINRKPFIISKLTFGTAQNIPDNVQEIKDSDKSPTLLDRSRDTSSVQVSKLFGSGFMSDQYQTESTSEGGEQDDLGRCYDMDGKANLESILQTNLPEPYQKFDEGNLKEGTPEGISDVVQNRGQKWSMEDRIEYSKTIYQD